MERKSKFLAINAQTNSSNFGFNYINLYNKTDFMCMNETEIRLPLAMRFEDIDEVIWQVPRKLNYKRFLVTQGKYGCTYVNNSILTKTPAVIDIVKDTVGAGDALFAVASLLALQNVDGELLTFLANCAGGYAANVMGNKESIDKEKLMNFVKETLA